MGERATEEHIEACKVLDSGGPSEPQMSRNRVPVGGQGPATGQAGEGMPRGRGKGTMKEGHDYSSKGRMHKGVHGNALQQAASPAEPPSPVITVRVALAFRKPQCENMP